MRTHPLRRVPAAIARLAIVAGFALMPIAARAMPPFAQAYGVDCSLCHTQVPTLNAYGRYVQRTGYASLDPKVLRRALPVWLGVNTWYDTQDPSQPHYTQFGNVALHAVGAIGNDVTYHFQQWIQQNDQAGDLDTFWVAYNNLLHKDGHLFVGKIEAPGPSPFSQWVDLAPFTTPEITVGEHAYELDANRWGVKMNYVHDWLDAEAGWLASNGGWSGSSDYAADTDKSFEYKLAYADPVHPLEGGIYGSRGSWPLAEGGFDQYWSLAGYVQRDPVGNFPGVLAIYQSGFDGNPGPGLGSARSRASTFELYEPLGNTGGLVSLRREWTNDGLGTQLQSGNADFSIPIARYLRLYVENYFAAHTTPGWRYMLWWTTPLTKVK